MHLSPPDVRLNLAAPSESTPRHSILHWAAEPVGKQHGDRTPAMLPEPPDGIGDVRVHLCLGHALQSFDLSL